MTLVVGILIALCSAAIAVVVSQRDHVLYLRRLLDAKQEHDRRVERAEAGLPELAPERRKPDNCPPGLDIRIREAIGKWKGPSTQQQKWQDVRAWRGDGKDWEWITAQLENETAELLAE